MPRPSKAQMSRCAETRLRFANGRVHALVLGLALALAGGLVYSQLEALSPSHLGHTGRDQCAICHAGHLRLSPAPPSIRVAPPRSVRTSGVVPPFIPPKPAPHTVTASRAPPCPAV